MGQKIAVGWEDRNECAVFVLEKLKILYGSRHSHQKHGVKKYRCAVLLFLDLPFIIWMWRILFQRFSAVMIFFIR